MDDREARRDASLNAYYKRRRGGNSFETGRQEELLIDARAWAETELSTIAAQVGNLGEIAKLVVKQTWDNFLPTHRYRSDFKLGYLEFASALWEEGLPSLEDRAIVALGNHPRSGTIRTADQPSNEPGPEGNSQPQRPPNGPTAGLPELPPKFQNAFEVAKAAAELLYVNRAEDFPHHPHLAESGFPQLIRIQAVFFAYCTESRNACREGDWAATQVTKSVETAWPIICDFYSLREHGASSDEAKSRFRFAIWKTIQDDPRWKQHLSELAALAERATAASSTTRAAAAQPGAYAVQEVPKVPTGLSCPSRYEIEKFAKGRFALVRDDLLAEYEKQKTQVLRQVRLTDNRGGYVPALISWGATRVRKMVLALADAYIDEFIRYSVPTDERAEKDLQTSAGQFAAGTITGISGEIELMAKRTKRPLQNPGGSLNRGINAAMKLAVNEGLLNMKQRIKSKGAEGTQRGSSPSTTPSEQVKGGHSDFLEKLSKDDPNYKVAKRFHLEAWADSYALNAKAFAGRASLSDYVEGCINTFNQAARTQVAIQDTSTIPEKCKELDVMVNASIGLIGQALKAESRRFGKANIIAAIDEYSRRVNEIAAHSKQQILKEELARFENRLATDG
jgi:hypothetical protein